MDLENNNAVVDLDTPVETESVENQEVAELEPVDESVETQEVAEPVRSESDRAFAEMRRQNEELSRKAQEAEKQAQELTNALGNWFPGETPEEKAIQAKAFYEERTPEEVKAEIEATRASEALQNELQSTKQELQSIKIQTMMANDLKTIQAIDSTIKSFDDLGNDYATYIKAGLPCEKAYYAIKADEAKNKVVTPKPIGAVNGDGSDEVFYAENDERLNDQNFVNKNFEQIKKSMARWK